MFCWLHEACSQGWAGTIMTGEGFHTAGKAGLREKVHVRQADRKVLTSSLPSSEVYQQKPSAQTSDGCH